MVLEDHTAVCQVNSVLFISEWCCIFFSFLDKIAFLGIFMIKTNTCSIYEQTFNKNGYLTGHACRIGSKTGKKISYTVRNKSCRFA